MRSPFLTRKPSLFPNVAETVNKQDIDVANFGPRDRGNELCQVQELDNDRPGQNLDDKESRIVCCTLLFSKYSHDNAQKGTSCCARQNSLGSNWVLWACPASKRAMSSVSESRYGIQKPV